MQMILSMLCAMMFAGVNLVVAQDRPEALGAMVSRIEVKGGSAWDVVTQIRAGLPEDALSGLSVEVPEADLREARIELLDVRSVPLGVALEYLSTAAKGFRAHYENGLWILRPLSSDQPSGGLIMRVYEVSDRTLLQVGITYDPESGLHDGAGKSWPSEKDWLAHFSPKTGQLILRADSEYHEDVSALFLLAKRGYTDLSIDGANKSEELMPNLPSD